MLDPKEQLIVALDVNSKAEACELVEKLGDAARWLKVGMTLFYAEGPAIVKEFKARGYKIFLDLKLHDIPHQVEGAVYSAAQTGADIISIHGLGSKEMISAARRGADRARLESNGALDIKLIAITVLTSHDEASFKELGFNCSIPEEVKRLAQNSIEAGADGIVCSPFETKEMRELLGDEVLLVCPGIRPKGSESADQKRVATPKACLLDGASHLVVGRPITKAEDPKVATEAILEEMN